MPWGAAIAAAGAIAGSALQAQGAKKGAAKAAAGQQAATEAYRQYNQPYYDAGTSALTRLDRLASGDFSGFTASPAYQFNLEQGQEGLLRGAASRGALNAGGTDVDLLRYSQGLASNEFGNYLSQLQYLTGLGQSSAQGLGGSASNAAANIGAIRGDAANTQGALYGNLASQLGSIGAQAFGQRQSTYRPPAYTGGGQGPGTYGGFGSEIGSFQQPPSNFGGYNFGGG